MSGEESPPRWARAVTGAIVGFVAATFVGALIACIALVVTLLAPSLGKSDIWLAAVRLIGCNYVIAIVYSAWRQGFRKRSAAP